MNTTHTTRTKRPNGAISTLAKGLNLSKRRTQALLALGCPDDLQAAILWRKQRETSGDSVAQLRHERIKLVQEQRERISLENQARRGELIERGRVFESTLQIVSMTRAELTRLPGEMAGRLAGLGESAIQKILREEITGILSRLSANCREARQLPDDEA